MALGPVGKGLNRPGADPPKTIAGYRAAPGWDPVTGWGSPDAQVLVPLLARYATHNSSNTRPRCWRSFGRTLAVGLGTVGLCFQEAVGAGPVERGDESGQRTGPCGGQLEA